MLTAWVTGSRGIDGAVRQAWQLPVHAHADALQRCDGEGDLTLRLSVLVAIWRLSVCVETTCEKDNASDSLLCE